MKSIYLDQNVFGHLLDRETGRPIRSGKFLMTTKATWAFGSLPRTSSNSRRPRTMHVDPRSPG